MRNVPHLTVEIRFVGHGYQMDIWDYTRTTQDGLGTLHSTICADFTDSHPSICDRTAQAQQTIIDALRSIESVEPECCPVCSRLLSDGKCALSHH